MLQGLASLVNLVDDVAPDGGALAGVACNALWSALQVRRPAASSAKAHHIVALQPRLATMLASAILVICYSGQNHYHHLARLAL